MRKLNVFQDHANGISDIRLGLWWKVCLGVITPVVLGYMMFDLFRTNLLGLFDTETGNYEGYSDAFILWGGWAVAAFAIIAGFVFMAIRWRSRDIVDEVDSQEREG